jgi:hypothetical protein
MQDIPLKDTSNFMWWKHLVHCRVYCSLQRRERKRERGRGRGRGRRRHRRARGGRREGSTSPATHARTRLVFHVIRNLSFNPMRIRVTSMMVHTRNSTVTRLPPVPFWRSQFGKLSHQDQPPPASYSPVWCLKSTARGKWSVRRSIRALRVVLALRRAAGPNSQADL